MSGPGTRLRPIAVAAVAAAFCPPDALAAQSSSVSYQRTAAGESDGAHRIFLGATQGWVRGRSNHRVAIHAGVGIGGGGDR